MIRINPFFLRQRSYHFRRNWSYISFPFPFKSSYVFPHTFETPKNEQIPFLRNTYKICHYKKDNGNLAYANISLMWFLKAKNSAAPLNLDLMVASSRLVVAIVRIL